MLRNIFGLGLYSSQDSINMSLMTVFKSGFYSSQASINEFTVFRLALKLAYNKNPQFLPNPSDILTIFPIFELIIFV